MSRPVAGLAVAWTLASTADNFVMFVLLWIAGPQGWTGAETALLVVAARVPTVAGGILGGRAVDRFGPVPMLIADGGARVVLMGALAVAGWGQHPSLWVVIGLCAAAGTTPPLAYSASRTLTPLLVDDESLPRVNAWLGIGDQLPMVLGAVLAGPALGLLGPGRAFLVPFAMMLIVAGIAIRLPRRRTTSPETAEVPRVRWSKGPVVGLIALSAVYYFTYGPFESVLPHFTRDQLRSGVSGYTVLWVAFGVAALSTVPLASWLGRRRPGLVNAIGALVWGLVTLPIVSMYTLPPAVAIFVVSGAVWGPYSAIETTALQRWVDPAAHGAMFGTQRALLAIASPLGAAAGALALDHTSPASILAISALSCSAAGAIAAWPLRAVGARRGP
ncbi:MFS transporter [Kribbella jejuensis]|uniref:Putative MFS family arabinose efflux permease n=1 Tax=Kribbella jejuensis TaxID=236068 RepID=A0A542EWE8_9ACTN|nr:MFS transporter [Kribbella jejuensis]TQJ19675.1 putative MFS family arabinose efflux permease [Kribbella jejuensis]